MPSIWQDVWQMHQTQPFQRSIQGFQEQCSQYQWKVTVHEQEPGIEMVNLSSLRLNSNHSTIIADLTTLSNKATIVVPYKVDMDSDENIRLFNVLTELFPSTTASNSSNKRWNQTKNI